MASKAKEGGLWETVKTIFWALIIAGVFRTLFFQPFWIPSGSMKDTLLIGDFLFVNKMAYGYSAWSCPGGICPFSGRILQGVIGGEPQRGDVVVFIHPTRHQVYVKRLIGLPGDRVQLRGGVLYLNGQEVPQTPAGEFHEVKAPQGSAGNTPICFNDPVPPGGDCIKQRMTETLPGGPSHDVLNAVNDPNRDDTPEFSVPEGNYFFMGDNRDNSADSRWSAVSGGVGMVPAEYLIGRADRIMFSSAGKSLFYFWTWRSDRFFKAIH